MRQFLPRSQCPSTHNSNEFPSTTAVKLTERQCSQGNKNPHRFRSSRQPASPPIQRDQGSFRGQRPVLRRSNSPVCRRRENRLTRISLAIVWSFLFCHFWKLIPTCYEVFFGTIDEQSPQWLEHIQNVSHFLIVLNSSINFLIYVAL